MNNKKRIKEIEERITLLQEEIDNYEPDPDDYEDQYCEMLNEISIVKIGNSEFDGSEVLRKLDPIAYQVGLTDYLDSIEVEHPDEYEIQKKIEDLQYELDDLIGEE